MSKGVDPLDVLHAPGTDELLTCQLISLSLQQRSGWLPIRATCREKQRSSRNSMKYLQLTKPVNAETVKFLHLASMWLNYALDAIARHGLQ